MIGLSEVQAPVLLSEREAQPAAPAPPTRNPTQKKLAQRVTTISLHSAPIDPRYGLLNLPLPQPCSPLAINWVPDCAEGSSRHHVACQIRALGILDPRALLRRPRQRCVPSPEELFF